MFASFLSAAAFLTEESTFVGHLLESLEMMLSRVFGRGEIWPIIIAVLVMYIMVHYLIFIFFIATRTALKMRAVSMKPVR